MCYPTGHSRLGLTMTSCPTAATLALFLLLSSSGLAQNRGRVAKGQSPDAGSQSVQNHIITVSRSGEAYAKPDLGILIMSIRSTSPIADEAVSENGRKAAASQAALTSLGFGSQDFQITSVTFGQAGGPRFPGQPEI